MRTLITVILLAIAAGRAPAGTANRSDTSALREAKLDMIARCQDRRVNAVDSLEQLAGDTDPLIRMRVYWAFASLQDTTAVTFLARKFDEENEESVRIAIADALGQSARLLAENGREGLALLLSTRSLAAPVPPPARAVYERLIEEIGKFGGKAGLAMLVKSASAAAIPGVETPLAMSIARFAINGVTTPSGVKYLLDLIKQGNPVQWQTAYALQRCGDQPGTRENLAVLVPLTGATDPLVRMNIAALFGKLKGDSACVEPLCKLAANDPDWRVRVNAVRALGTFTAFAGVPEVLTTALHSDNLNVALTAATAAGNLAPADARTTAANAALASALETLTENSDGAAPWQLQAEAAMSLAKIEGADAVKFIHTGKAKPRQLRGLLLAALGRTHAAASLGDLLAAAGGNDTIVARSALDALGELAPALPKDAEQAKSIDRMNKAIVRALASPDVALVTTAAGLLGDSLFQSPSSVMPLADALRRAKLPGDVEAMQAICETLGKLKDQRAVATLKETLERDDRTVVLAAAAALTAITGEKIDPPAPAESPRTPADYSWLRAFTRKPHVDTLRASIITSRGTINVLLFADAAPMTVTSFLKLAKKGFYRNLLFHRVVPNFVVQGGDPRGDGWGGPGYAIRSEFAPLSYETGTLGMASAGKDTEGSQFFITHSPQPHLDGRYTIFGKVVSGMDVVDAIRIGDRIVDVTYTP